jgi:hypothetical protein
MGTTFFDGNPQHDHAMTGTQELADISAEDIMQFGLAFWAVSAVELDLFTELAVARLRTQQRAP